MLRIRSAPKPIFFSRKGAKGRVFLIVIGSRERGGSLAGAPHCMNEEDDREIRLRTILAGCSEIADGAQKKMGQLESGRYGKAYPTKFELSR